MITASSEVRASRLASPGSPLFGIWERKIRFLAEAVWRAGVAEKPLPICGAGGQGKRGGLATGFW